MLGGIQRPQLFKRFVSISPLHLLSWPYCLKDLIDVITFHPIPAIENFAMHEVVLIPSSGQLVLTVF